MFTKPQKLIEVPKLVGHMYEDLEDYPQFDLTREDVYDDNYPAGMVISQKPNAGDQVVDGTKLIATVSRGPVPKEITMDNLVGMDETSAKNLLDSYELSLNIVVEEEHSPTVEVGKVIRTIPELGTELDKYDNVILYVSAGPEINISAMPNVINKTEEMAKNILDSQKLDLDISIQEQYDSEVEKGCIIKTNPASGEQLKTGQKVTLYISKGPELKVVPNVVGMDIETAVKVITGAGFKTPSIKTVESEEEKNTVVNQNPAKDTDWDITQAIELEISEGPKPTEPPTEDITKDVSLNLHGMADLDEAHVSIVRDGVEIYNDTVPAGTKSVILYDEVGNGPVVYTIVINFADGWETTVDFS
jgi:serine/threonine-protein kinase